MGPAALADHAHRTAPRRGLSAALAPHRLRARPALDRTAATPSQRPASRRSTPRPARPRKIALDKHTVELLTAHRQLWRAALRCTRLRAEPRRLRVLPRARRLRRRTCHGPSASATAARTPPEAPQHPLALACATTRPPSSSPPASTSAPSPAASATAAAAPRRSRSTPAGSTKPTAAQPTLWRRSSPGLSPHPPLRAAHTRSSPRSSRADPHGPIQAR